MISPYFWCAVGALTLKSTVRPVDGLTSCLMMNGLTTKAFFSTAFLHLPCLLECPFYSWRWRTAQILVVTRWKSSTILHSAFGSPPHRTPRPVHLNLGLDTPCWWFHGTSVSFKSSGNSLYPCEWFLMFFHLKHAQKNAPGKTVKVLLDLWPQRSKGSEKISEH